MPGGPPEGATEVGDGLLPLATTSSSIASASSVCASGRGEKTLVARAEARRLAQHR
jgi:hypothetical protein